TEKKRWWQRISFKKLNRKYFFLMSHDETMEPIVDFRVNLMNIIIIGIASAFVLIAITTVIIAFTPLREYIPGYTDTSLQRDVYALSQRADSIEAELRRKDNYFNNLKLIVEGYDFDSDSLHNDIYAPVANFDIDTIEIRKSVQDSMLRAEFEEANFYNLTAPTQLVKAHHFGVSNFFTPLTGVITQPYDPDNRHYGIDVAAKENQVIKAALDGTVVISSWTPDFGYTIGIQHENNYLSTYKHNSTLLKKEGDFVKAGEAIAIIGESGALTTGPHLHFELWHNGVSVNPQEYIDFERRADENF
nr:peptidoglycan DD-metalloendopeptidase family protein [Bacteroidales bacterium]